MPSIGPHNSERLVHAIVRVQVGSATDGLCQQRHLVTECGESPAHLHHGHAVRSGRWQCGVANVKDTHQLAPSLRYKPLPGSAVGGGSAVSAYPRRCRMGSMTTVSAFPPLVSDPTHPDVGPGNLKIFNCQRTSRTRATRPGPGRPAGYAEGSQPVGVTGDIGPSRIRSVCGPRPLWRYRREKIDLWRSAGSDSGRCDNRHREDPSHGGALNRRLCQVKGRKSTAPPELCPLPRSGCPSARITRAGRRCRRCG